MLIKRFFCFLCIVTSFSSATGFPQFAKLGALFRENDPLEKVLKSAVLAINHVNYKTNRSPHTYFALNRSTINDDLFETNKTVCEMLGNEIAAIFGPSDRAASRHVEDICEMVDMPHIVGHWDLQPIKLMSFNFYPHAETLAKAFLKIVQDYRWKTYTIFYDSSESLVRMSELLKKWDPRGYVVTIRYLNATTDFRPMFLEIKKTKEVNLVIDCSYDILERVLEQCLQVGLLSNQYNVIVTNLDLHLIDLDRYRYSGMNLTGVRLLDVDYTGSKGILAKFLQEMGLKSVNKLRIEEALMYDSVNFFAKALKRSIHAFDVDADDDVKFLQCGCKNFWEYGAILSNYIRSTEKRGLTGIVRFDNRGFRTDFELDILSLRSEGLKKIATYNSTRPIDWPIDPIPSDRDLHNNSFRVLISLVPPYNMLTESSAMRSGNDRYEGFGIDIIHKLSEMLHFNYTFIETASDYGKQLDGPAHKWSGMVGKLIEGEADLAITDLTITADRESAVDFTMPFMNLGISILYRKPTKAAPYLFSFLSPFAGKVWICLMGSYLLCSLLLFVIGRMSPKEWTNPYPCVDEPEVLENQFTLKNSLWFMTGSIMQQGSEIAPIGLSTRMLASSWWFFCLIIVSSYTANLAAFLVVETTVKPIKSAEDLADMNGAIKYGAKEGGATYEFFKVSMNPTYQKMFKYMEANKADVMTATNEEGRDKVLDANQNYAFLMESSSIQYIIQRECNLSQIGGLIDAKGYGIAMRKNSKYRHVFNEAVLELQEHGVISELKKKWWEQNRGGGRCKGELLSPASKLTLDHVGGVFVVLGIGVAFAIPFAFWELIWEVGLRAYKDRLSFKEEFVEEMKSVAKSKSSVKPARRRKKSSRLMDSSVTGSTPSV